MLVAKLNETKIEAFIAQRGPEYRCPSCSGVVVLKKGRMVIDHFAHKPPTDCAWAKGETRAHLEAKSFVFEALIERGLRAEIEKVVDTLHGDRRADVMVWSPNGCRVAFELQHTPIELNEIEARSFSYARAGIAQIWIPFLRETVWSDGEANEGGWFVERYSPRPFERWVHGLNGKNGMWMYDPAEKKFWLADMKAHQMYIEETSWYTEGGEEDSAGGYSRWSKRYRELTLKGPFEFQNLRIRLKYRESFSTKRYNWPAGYVARLTHA